MINTFRNRAQIMSAPASRILLVCSLVFAITACGKDSGDGDVVDTILLPTDLVLDLPCEDFGIFTETCALDDPDNPYARVNVNNDNKFDLAGAAPSPKARVYLWATAMARDPSGENQVNMAKAFYALSNASCSQLIQDQAQRAYRAVLDNHFTAVTFFATDDFGAPFPNVFYPFPVKSLAVDDLRLGVAGAAPVSPACPVSFTGLMFDPDPGRNDFVARDVLNSWGYVFDDVLNNVTIR